MIIFFKNKNQIFFTKKQFITSNFQTYHRWERAWEVEKQSNCSAEVSPKEVGQNQPTWTRIGKATTERSQIKMSFEKDSIGNDTVA